MKDVINKIHKLFIDVMQSDDFDYIVITNDGFYFYRGSDVVAYFKLLSEMAHVFSDIVNKSLSVFERAFIPLIDNYANQVIGSFFNRHPGKVIAILKDGRIMIGDGNVWYDETYTDLNEVINA